MARYMNRPSIFEIATAYEDGKNGEIKRQQNQKQMLSSIPIELGMVKKAR